MRTRVLSVNTKSVHRALGAEPRMPCKKPESKPEYPNAAKPRRRVLEEEQAQPNDPKDLALGIGLTKLPNL